MTAKVLSCWSNGDLMLVALGWAIYGLLSGLLLGWALWRNDNGTVRDK